MDPGIVSEAIKDLMASAGIKAKKVVTAVGGRDVIIKKINMDRMKEAEAREVIRWEAEQHVPFDMDNVELDFQILDPEGEGLQMTVLLVAAKRELVEHKVALLADARAGRQRDRRGRVRAPQCLRDQLPRGDGRGGRPGQHRARDHQHQHPGRRRPGPHPRHPDRHPPVQGRSPARARALGRRGRRPPARYHVERCARSAARGAGRGARRRHRAGGRVPPVGQPFGRRDRVGSSPPVAAPAFRGSTRCCPTGSGSRSSWPTRSRSSRWPTVCSIPCLWTKWHPC